MAETCLWIQNVLSSAEIEMMQDHIFRVEEKSVRECKKGDWSDSEGNGRNAEEWG